MAEGGDLPKPTGEQLSKPQGMVPESSLGTGPRIPVERFTIKSTHSPSSILEEGAKQVANTPPEQLMKSSQWRRDLLNNQQGNEPAQPAPDPGKPNK